MNKPFLAALLLLGVLLLAFGLGPVLLRTPAERPNVVFILIDTLRADRLHAQRNGVPVMPYLSRFAAQSVVFTHAVSPCSWTRPAMASLLTSRNVDAHQVYYSSAEGRGDVLAEGWETLAEYLAAHGYDTLGFVTNGNIQEAFGFAQGFAPGRYTFVDQAPASDVTNHLLGRLGELAPPFYVYAHYNDPHVPYAPPTPHREAFGPLPEVPEADAPVFASTEAFMAFYMDRVRYFLDLIDAPTLPMLTEAGQERVLTLYDGECHFVDAEAGRLIDAIRAAHPNTIFVVMADHGEEFWERGGMGHGTSLYEEQLVVPMLLQGPGLAPRTVAQTVNTVGLLPTLARLIGLPARPGWQGQNLLAPDAGGPVHARTLGSFKEDHVDKAAYYDGTGMKLIDDRTAQHTALYDLALDPRETKDLAAGRDSEHQTLDAALQSALEQDRLHFTQHGSDRTTVEVGPETQRMLDALGYGAAETPRPTGPP